MALMLNGIKYRKESRNWQKLYDATAPKIGDDAPDFELRDVSSKQSVKLSDYRGKTPVVLIFGSYT